MANGLRAALIAARLLSGVKPATTEEVRHTFTAPQPVVPQPYSRTETSAFLVQPLTEKGAGRIILGGSRADLGDLPTA